MKKLKKSKRLSAPLVEKFKVITQAYVKFFKGEKFNQHEVEWYSYIVKVLDSMHKKGRELK